MAKHSEDAARINYFQRCWDLGYHNLLPVVPPSGGITNAGKRPGILMPGGTWIGKTAKDFTATPETIDEWHRMGASVGLSCDGSGLVGIDIDTLTARWADHIVGLAHEMLGPAPRRIGRSPKVLLPYNCPPDMRYAQVRFNDAEGRPRLATPARRLAPGLIETLAGEFKWFVAHGVHPQTRQAYAWPDGMPPRAELTSITLAQRDVFMEQLRIELPEALRLLSGSSKALAPEKLRGPLQLVAEAVRATPNDPAVLGYDQWRNMAIALRGAVDYRDGLELFEEWTNKAGIENPTEKAYRVFASIESARELGADYIYHQAEKAGWRGFAAPWFDEHPQIEVEAPYESIFGPAADAAEGLRISADGWAFDPLTIPPRDFLYGTHIVRRFASMTVAPSKVGKSSLATVDILAMVTGRTLLPRMRPKGALRVWYINGEDPLEELQRRLWAAMLHYKISADEIGDRLFINSGRSLRLVVAVEDRNGVKLLKPVIDGLTAELRRLAIDVLVIDPFVSSHQVKENDNSGIDAVMTEWIMLADVCGVGIEFVHHARKAGVGEDPDGSVDAARGATALVAKMRSVRALAKMTKTQAKQLGLTTAYRSLFRVTDAASNLAPWVDDETEWLRLENVDLGNGPVDGDGASSRWSEGDHVAVVAAWSVGANDGTQEVKFAVLQALGAEEWREDAQAKAGWVGNVIAAALGLDHEDPDDRASIKRMIKAWIKGNVLERVQRKDKKNSAMRWYVKARSVFD